MATSGIARTMVGSAAWDARDVADARRRYPGVNLAAWAAEHGLRFHGSANTSGWSAVLPGEPELQFNVVRGTSPGGRDVCLWHYRHPIPLVWGPGGPTLGPETHQDLRVGTSLYAQPSLGFVGIPCTTAGVAVPETALLAAFSVTLRAGVPAKPAVPLPGEAVELMAGPLGALLRIGSRHTVFELAFRFRMLLLSRNGYADEAGMDELLTMLDDGARALCTATAPPRVPVPFNTPLLPVVWSQTQSAAHRSWPPSTMLEQVHRLARRYRLELEDPRLYHWAFPKIPVPGTAWAVLLGRLPGAGPVARIALHTEAPLPGGVGRTALLLPAAGVPETEPGGVQVLGNAVPMRYAISDGIFAVWVTRNGASGLGPVGALLGPGIALAQRLGVPVG